VEGRRNKPVGFFFIYFRRVPGSDLLAAIGAKQRSMVLGEINRALNNPVVVHFYKIALPHFLIAGNQAFAIGAADPQEMASPYLFAIGVLVYRHFSPRKITGPYLLSGILSRNNTTKTGSLIFDFYQFPVGMRFHEADNFVN
jgi:hypothetical protein